MILTEENKVKLASKQWRMNNLYKIVNERGELMTFKLRDEQDSFMRNRTNRNIILKARQLGFCLHPDTKVLREDLVWVKIKDLRPGERVVAVDEHTGSRGVGRKMRTADVEAVVKVFRKAYRITLANGKELVCTGQHPWLTRKSGSDCKWRAIEEREGLQGVIKVGTKIRQVTDVWGDGKNYEDGWFAGVIDGEGSLSRSKTCLSVAQVEGSVFDRMLKYVKDRGYNYRIESDTRKAGDSSKLGDKVVHKICIGRMNELFRVLGETKPSRFRERENFWEGRQLPGKRTGYGWVEVVKIEELEEMEMIDLQTSTGTYIAEGFVSHNTTLACIDFLDDCLFNQNLTAVIIAHKQDQLEVIFRRVQIAWDNFYKDFGESLGFRADTSRTNLLKFNTGSLIRVALSSRGDTVQRLHVSEFGKICAQYPLKAEEILTGAFPSVPSDGRITIESTAEGETGYFADMFWEAWNNKEINHNKQFKAFFFPWFLQKKYRIEDDAIKVPAIYRSINLRQYQTLHNLDDAQMRWYYLTFKEQRDKMKQEYPTTPEEAFEASEDKFFDASVIQLHKKNYAEDGEVIGGWTFYEKYNPMHTYVIGSDPAEGIGLDSSVAHVIDCSYRYNGRIMPKVVAVFEDNKMPPDMFAHELRRVGIMYGNALIGVERNGNGIATIAELKQHYYNLYMEMRKVKMQDVQTERIGFATTSGTKSMVLYNLATALREDNIIVPDVPTLDELRRYDTRHLKTLKLDPQMTHHLDRVMSLAIAYEMVTHVGEVDYVYDDAGYVEFDPHAGLSI